MTARSCVGVAAGLLAMSCQVQPPEPPEPVPRLSRDVLAHFRLGDPDSPPPLEPVHVLGESSEADLEGEDAPAAGIELEDVLHSVEANFPLILAAMEEVEIAQGRALQAKGAFDTRVGTRGKFDVEGYYDADVLDVSVVQPTTLWGATFEGGYQLGTGQFPIYDGGDKTNEDGEFRLGVNVPLLQGGSIDPRRVELWRARIQEEQAEPLVMEKRLEATRKAADAYWRWMSWGRRREIARRLLALAEDRQEQVRLAVDEGQLARINLTDNERLIVERRSNLARTERGLQQAAILLSLYWRDLEGRPRVPKDRALPYEFPSPRDPSEVLVTDDIDIALARRPEIRAVELELSRLGLDEALARNQMLPRLNLGLFASQDLGQPVNEPDDKGPFELEALLRFEIPVQRRKPRGKLAETEAKISKLEREFQYVKEVVITDVRDAVSALTQTWERLGQARENVRLAGELADAERLQLSVGESDLFRVNVREQQAALAAASLVEVLEEHFRALAQYRSVLGIPYDEVVAGEAIGGGPRAWRPAP